jgi:hypothetical protein
MRRLQNRSMFLPDGILLDPTDPIASRSLTFAIVNVEKDAKKKKFFGRPPKNFMIILWA